MTEKKLVLLLLTAATMFAGCAGVEDSANALSEGGTGESQTIGFSAYVNRGTTRGGTAGELSLASLKTGAHSGDGFGVYAYYTGTHIYDMLSLPNFMLNEHVVWQEISSPASWTYSPTKYWPNGEGEATGVAGKIPHYVSFFAYAPYTPVSESTGCADDGSTTGIMALRRSIDEGDPIVRYTISTQATQSVDLCWGEPVLNATKPEGVAPSPITFNFKHALSALNVQIDADLDEQGGHTNDRDAFTRIWVRSVTFEGFTDKGELNLRDGNWYSPDCDCALEKRPYTTYDGRIDGHEGLAEDRNERYTGLNPVIVQGAPYDPTQFATQLSCTNTALTGVTKAAVNLFDVTGVSGDAAALAAPIYVIPTGAPLHVSITYDVETYDPKLVSQYLADGATHGSTITNTITANIKTGGTALTMQAGKKYDLRLHLGLVSVKVEAKVTPWPSESESTDVIPSADVDVPKN